MTKLYSLLLSWTLFVSAGYALPFGGAPSAVPEGRVSGKFFGEADFAHAEPLGFASLAVGTPKSFKFYRNNGITMNLTAKGSGVVLGETCLIIPETSPSNPSHVAGIRGLYQMDYNSAALSNPPSTATLEITFAEGLPTTGYQLFVDLDASERIDIMAYNSSNVLIPFSDITFTQQNGLMTNGSTHPNTIWSDIGSSYTGRINDNGTGANVNNPVATLRSNQVIKRLVYFVQHNPGNSTLTTFTNTFRFNFVTPTSPATVYVNHAAAGANNGTSWTDAFTSLQTGIENAFPGDQLWVAKGTYKPSSAYERTNTSRFYHFRIPNSVSIYGGFVSGQSATSQRTDFGIGGANETVMSGDVNGDDNYTTWTNLGENNYHVIYHPAGTCMGTGTRLDGVTVRGGNADLTTGVDADGAGAYLTEHTPIRFVGVNFIRNSSYDDGAAIYLINDGNDDSSRVYFTGCDFRNNRTTNSIGNGTLYCTNDSEASLVDVEFRQNAVAGDGGGIFATSAAALTLIDVTLADNTAASDGGGMVTADVNTAVTATGLTVTGNTATSVDGGGIQCRSSSSFTATRITVSGNTAGDDGGGISVEDASTTVNLTNLLLVGNNASGSGGEGGGIFIFNTTNVTINNGTIAGNQSGSHGGGLRTSEVSPDNAAVALNNTIIWGNSAGASASGNQIYRGSNTTATLRNSCYKNGTNDVFNSLILGSPNTNITTDPQFRNSVTGDYRLTSGSPAADAGNDSHNSQTTDIRGTGFGRKLLKTDASTAGTIDMGAYEYNSGSDANKSWTNGTGNNLWNVAGNWSDNAAPHANDILEIPSGTPQLNVDFTTDRTVTFSGTSGFTLLPTTGFSVGATGTLALGGRPVTLKSDATGTARIGQVLGSITGATNVTVERYLPAGRKWRFLCAPVIGGSNNTVFYNWQNNGTPAGATGVEIWGPSGTANPSATGSNGLAVGPHPSMRSYDVTWQGIINTRTTELFNATTNNGFSLFLTGPYNNGSTQYIGGPGNLPNGIASTLSATGTLVTGTHTKNLNAVSAGQFFLVANPYASPVDPRSFTDAGTVNRTNLQGTLHMWDAKQGGDYNLGRFVSYSIAGGAYSNAGPGTGYPDNSVLIQSGQSFFVQAINAGAATLVFRESSKGTASTMSMMGDSDEKRRIPSLRFQLWQDTVNYDGAVAFFHDAGSKGIDEHDARKLLNGSDNLGLRREGRTLVFEHRPALASNDTLHLHLGQMRQQTFTLSIEPEGLPLAEASGLRLLDRYTGRETPIKTEGRTRVEFTVNADSASTGERFLVVLAAKPTNNGTSAEPDPLVKMKPYPNPVSGSSKFRVELDPERAPWGVNLIDAGGRTVWSRGRVEAVEGRLEVDMSAMAAGVYHLVMTDSKGEVTVSKVLKQ